MVNKPNPLFKRGALKRTLNSVFWSTEYDYTQRQCCYQPADTQAELLSRSSSGQTP